MAYGRFDRYRAGELKSTTYINIPANTSIWDWIHDNTNKRDRTLIILDGASKLCYMLGLFEEMGNGRIELDTPSSATLDESGKATGYDMSVHLFVFGSGTAVLSCRFDTGSRFRVLDYSNYIKDAPTANLSCRNRLDDMQSSIASLRAALCEVGYGDWKPTISSLAFCSYKANLPTEPIYIHDEREVKKHERQSYFGGQIIQFGIGVIHQPVYYVDVCSMYPSVMHEHRFPTKLKSYYTDVNCTPARLHANPLCCIARCIVHSDSYRYPVRRDDNTIYAIGEFETTLAGPELQLAVELGHVVKILDISEYTLKPIFREHIQRLWNKRCDFEDSGNVQLANCVKLLMNSLYGKFAQLSSDLEFSPSTFPPIQWGMYREYTKDRTQFADYRVCNWQAFRIAERSEISSSIPAIPSFITSYGRRLMFSMRLLAGEHNVYYQGVDALLVNSAGLQRMQDAGIIHQRKLGGVRIDKSATRAVVYGPNHYRVGDRLCQSGAKATAIRQGDSQFVDVRTPTIAETAFIGPQQQYTEKTVTVFSEIAASEAAKQQFQRYEPIKLHLV